MAKIGEKEFFYLNEHVLNFSGVFQESFKFVSTSRVISKTVMKVFQELVLNFSSVFLVFFKSVLRVFQKSFTWVLRVFQEFFKTVLRVFQGCLKYFQRDSSVFLE